MKKILVCLILALSVLLSLFNVSYAANDEFSLLTKLGITSDFSDNETVLTRKDLCELAIEITGASIIKNGKAVFLDVPEKHKDFAVINTAYLNGLVAGHSDMTFKPEQVAVTTDTACIFATMLGYGGLARNMSRDEFDAFCIEIVADAGVFSGSNYGELTRYKFGKMLLKTLEANIAMVNINTNGVTYSTSNEMYITSKYGLTVLKGTLQAVGEASIRNIQPVSYGHVLIDGMLYESNGFNAIDYLGQKVKAVVDDEEKLLISIIPLTDDEIVIDAKDIISFENFVIEYWDDDKVKTQTISQSSRIILNEKNASYDESLIKPLVGSIKLVGDTSVFENVIVTSEVYVKVGSISEDVLLDSILNKKIDLTDKDIVCYYGGQKSDLNSVNRDSYLRIAADKIKIDTDGVVWIDNANSERLIINIISHEEVQGKVTGHSEEYVNINNNNYTYSNYLMTLIQKGLIKKPALAAQGVFIVNEKGELIAYKNESVFTAQNNYRYGYILKCFEDEVGEGICFVLVNDSAERVVLNASSKFRLNDERKTSLESLKVSDGANTDLYVDGELRRQLVMFKLNDKGEITALYTAKDYANQYLLNSNSIATEVPNPTYKEEGYGGYDEEKFSLDYVAKSQLYRKGFEHLYSFKEDTILFTVPKDPSNTKKYQILMTGASNGFEYDNSYSMSVYNVDEDYSMGIILQDYSLSAETGATDLGYMYTGGQHQSHIITSESMVWNDDVGEVMKQYEADAFVYGSPGVTQTKYLVTDDYTLTAGDKHITEFNGTTFDQLSPGDIIHYYTDSEGMINRFRLVLKMSSRFNRDGSITYGKLTLPSNSMEGSMIVCLSKVVGYDSSGNLLCSYSGTNDFETLYKVAKTSNVYLYGRERQNGMVIDFTDIEIDDTIVTRSESGAVKEIFVYR